ncbi:MAG: isoprenylcysteine carboxylmethyltransferase family protein [Acidobacteriota bacterium]
MSLAAYLRQKDMMRASEFEFRHRFWVIILIFFAGFSCYIFEPVNAVQWLIKAPGGTSPAAAFYPTVPAARVIFAVGAFLVFAAAAIRTWGTAYLKDEVVRDSVVRAERLVADGPYRFVRNPLYLGSLLMAAGIGTLASPIGWLVLMAGMMLAVLRLIGREEAFLLEQQGGAYCAYLEQVPKLWPSLRPRLPAGGAEPRWGQAWIGEMGMWVLFAGSADFAFTLNGRVFDIIVIAGLLLSRVAQISTKRRAQHRSA